MQISKLALIISSFFAGCASNGMPGMGGDDGGGDDDGDVPFTGGVSTLSGAAMAGYVDGARKVARFANPVNVAYRDGLVYVADFDNGKLRVIDADTHVTRTLVGQPSFKRPFGMAFAANGMLYVSTDNDQNGNHTTMSGTIWRVDVESGAAAVLANAIGRPRGLAVLPDGRLAVADYLHHVIELVDPHTGTVTPIAGAWDVKGMIDGAGAVARFSAPYGIAVRGDGKLIVADYDNNRIRLVGLDGTTATLSGASDPGFVDGATAAARFSHPQAVSIAASGDVLITDPGNFRVRRIAGDHVETIAGNGTGGYADVDDRLASQLYGLEGLAVVPDGSMIYIADGNRGEDKPYNRVRQIKLD
jgi:DNA-binding beta-propeller fold protein YncE